jgi:hypothetical protein
MKVSSRPAGPTHTMLAKGSGAPVQNARRLQGVPFTRPRWVGPAGIGMVLGSTCHRCQRVHRRHRTRRHGPHRRGSRRAVVIVNASLSPSHRSREGRSVWERCLCSCELRAAMRSCARAPALLHGWATWSPGPCLSDPTSLFPPARTLFCSLVPSAAR